MKGNKDPFVEVHFTVARCTWVKHNTSDMTFHFSIVKGILLNINLQTSKFTDIDKFI